MPLMEGSKPNKTKKSSRTHPHFHKSPKKTTFHRFNNKKRLLVHVGSKKFTSRRRTSPILVLISKKNKKGRMITLKMSSKDTRNKSNKK